MGYEMAITFETEEDFQQAVMKVIRDNLRIDVSASKNYVEVTLSDVLTSSTIDNSTSWIEHYED